MVGETELLRVIADIYEAALAPEQWPLALENVAEFCGARWGVMGTFPRSAAPSTLHFPPPDSAIVTAFDARYNVPETNPAIPRLLAAPSGKILRRREELTDAEWERTGLYNDIYRPTETHDALCVKLVCSEDALVVIGFNRLRHLGAFEDSHLAALRAAIPHLQRAVQTYLRLHDLEAHRAAHEALWNRLNCGVILLREDGRTLWSNAKADAILAAGDGLQSRAGVLSAATPAETAELGRLIANAALCANARRGAPGGTLALSRPGKSRKLSVFVAPFRSEQHVIARAPSVVVLVNDPDPPQEAQHLFARCYGLTPREAALTRLLAKGCGLRDAADRLGMSSATARSHLRQVFAKTDTHRQAELVSLFFRSMPPWR
jgi:DNA-binding CsgD family transcriptional regulator